MTNDTDARYTEVPIPPGLCLFLYNNWPAYENYREQNEQPIDEVFIIPIARSVVGFDLLAIGVHWDGWRLRTGQESKGA